MLDEPNIAGIESIIPVDLISTPKKQKEPDISGIDAILSAGKTKKPNPNANRFTPTTSDWNISKVPDLQQYYKQTFGADLPITNYGQGKIHNQAGYNYDHRGAMDVPFAVGQKIEPYLKENDIPYTKFSSVIPGVATGPHYHIGLPSKKTDKQYPVGTTLASEESEQQPSITGEEPNIEGIDKLLAQEPFTKVIKQVAQTSQEPNIDSIEQVIDPSLAVDPLKIGNFKMADNSRYSYAAIAAAGWTQHNKPLIVGKNPNEMGAPIIVESKGKALSVSDATDLWLNAWNPEYKKLNDQYRAETGINMVDVGNPNSIVPYGDGKAYHYKIQARPTRETQALFESYKAAKANGNNGVAATVATANLAAQQRNAYITEYNAALDKMEAAREDHPYLKDLAGVFPALQTIRGGKDIRDNAILQQTMLADFQLLNNIKNLGEALWIGNTKGYDSQEYLDKIGQEKADQSMFESSEASIPQAKSFGQKVERGVVSGAIATPKFMAVGALGGSYALPVLVYLENLHKGNIEAARQALPMAIMAGIGHGLGEFTNAGTAVGRHKITFDKEGNVLKADVELGEIDRGAGSSAPFRRVSKNDLSILKDQLVTGRNLSVAQLSPFERQLILRGTNALTLAGSSLVTNPQQNLTDTLSNIVVGLSFPVGKSPSEVKFPTLDLPVEKLAAQRLGLEPAKVNVPLEPSKIISGQERGVSTTYLPSGEAPTNTYKERESSSLTNATLEKGFKATASGSFVNLPLDIAALNYLDLERSLKDGSYLNKGDSLTDNIRRQQSIQVAMETLKKGLPDEALNFYRQNETAIRSTLKSNYDLQEQKLNLQRKNISIEDIKPNDLNPSPMVTGEETSKQTLGSIGINNKYTNQETAQDILKNFFNITKSKQGTFQASGLPYADVIIKKSGDAAYLGAFFIEDFYHRGIEPTVDLLLNKLKTSLGDYGQYISEDAAKHIFENGMKYYQSNNADPFFSKMKQDAAEKLPNRMTAEQALNVLKGHTNEFAWTVGLETFLNDKKVEKFSKQELIDIINKGQVRVEASVASDEGKKYVDQAANDYIDKYQSVEDLSTKSKIYKEAQRVGREFPDSEQEKDILTIVKSMEMYGQDLPRYSLKAYTGEKLELPGAENSKEVKLISGTTERRALDRQIKFEQQLIRDYSVTFDDLESSDKIPETKRQELRDLRAANVKEYKTLYKSAHWDEPNVVAHYRSNDRTTTDGIKVYHSEEFQSDWNHDIREQGLKAPANLSLDNYEKYGYEARLVKNIFHGADSWIFGLKDNLSETNYSDTLPSTKFMTKEDAVREFIQNLKADDKNLVERNPFMEHSWKELVLKRFLRDAVVAKDEQGNYKYDGVTWTTARQQKERYGKVLEGKEFKWFKNPDGSYSFDLRNDNEWSMPHELRSISLERFAELTTKEAAQEVRDQENKNKYVLTNVPDRPYNERVFYKGPLEHDIYLDFNDFNAKTFSTEEEANIEAAKMKGKRGVDLSLVLNENLKGQFSLKEAVELRSGIGKYSDYDVAFVNMAKKIGKRFGASYSEKEIPTEYMANIPEGQETPNIEMKKEKVHFLEITPSMRESLSKEGFSLYGLGGSEKLKSPEVGVRNKITTQQAFDEHRNNLVEAILQEQNNIPTPTETGGVFNSGLSPDGLIDSLKLTWSDAKDFGDFAKELIGRFGESIKPYLNDLWIQVKGFSDKVGNGIDALDNYLSQGENSPYYKARQEKESGILRFGLKPKTPAEIAAKEYKDSRKKMPYYEWFSLWRGVGLAQLSTDFGQVYDVMRGGQRVKEALGTNVLNHLGAANNLISHGADAQAVADNIWIGNEQKQLYTNSELSAGDPTLNRPALSPDQIQAYRHIRSAIDIALDIRRETKLYSMRQKAYRLNDQLANETPGTSAHDLILGKLLDLDGNITKVKDHFEQLKKEGYISTQRRGPIAAFAENPSFTSGTDEAKLYNHFDTVKEAQTWLDSMEKKFGATNMKIYDIRKPNDLRSLSNKMTPGQFEDLLDSAGVNPKDPEIEKLRDEVYSRFPTFGYELQRDFTKGYDRNWQFALESIAHQTETYTSSFYSRVAGEEATKKLDALDLQNKDYSLYLTSQKYIDHEISSPMDTGFGSHLEKYAPDIADKLPQWLRNNLSAGGMRKGVYLFQLGYDINQLYLNALAQPVTQTYNYFSRVEHNGITLKGVEPEQYFLKAGEFTGRLGKEYLQKIADPSYVDAKIPQELKDILDRLKSERVIEPEFNRSLLELESEKTATAKAQNVIDNSKSFAKRFFSMKQQEHWAGVFMRMGEQTTRTHVATEAYLVGTEKFNLQGEDLVDFIVRAVDATQSNPSRAEAPLIVRGSQNTGEVRKLLYQFNAFNHMWLENLALNVRADFENTYAGKKSGLTAIKNPLQTSKNILLDIKENKAATLQRQFAPLILMGGIRGLPLAGFATVLYTLLTGDDPKKHFDKWFGRDTALESFALYGMTGNAALSNRLTPSVPFLDQIRVNKDLKSTISDTLSATNIPAIATSAQIMRGFADIFAGEKLRALGELGPIKPIRGMATAERYREEGIRTRANRTLVPKSKVSKLQLVGQTIGLVPTPLLENYEKTRTKNLQNIHRQTISPLIRKAKRIL